jgi:hypothetical protein
MQLSEWLLKENLGFAAAARSILIDGVNPGATLARIARGERKPDADTVERIRIFTAGAVTAADMQEVRLAWLRQNRPEKFDTAGTVHMEAAE